MIDAFAVFFAIEEVPFILVLIGIDYFALVGSLIIDPFSIIDCSAEVFKHPMTVFFVFDPVTNILISIFVIVGTFTVLFPVEPIALVSLTIGISIYPKAVLTVLVPLAVISSCTAIGVNSSTVFLAIQELSLILFTISIDVETIRCELIFLPGAHIDVLIWKRVDALARATLLVLPNVFSTVRVGHLLILWSEAA